MLLSNHFFPLLCVDYYNVYETQLIIFRAHDFNMAVHYKTRILSFRHLLEIETVSFHVFFLCFNLKNENLDRATSQQKDIKDFSMKTGCTGIV